MTIIAPSVLSANFADLRKDIEDMNNSETGWIHYDVMDGHFVPNISFGPSIMKTISEYTDLPIDVHIMVSNPLQVVDYFAGLKVYMLTFHYEACDDNNLIPVIEKIRRNGFKVGVSIKPKTQPWEIKSILDKVDMVLVMSVEPGFGGQKFMPEALDKLDWLHEYRTRHQLDYLLEIDGGINGETGKLAVEHHCDVLVAGSYVFKYPEGIAAGVKSLL